MNPVPVPGAIRRLALCATVAVAWTLASAGGAHAAPPAGTPIGNQASATYLDASATARTATSNLVTTIVQQVASFTLAIDGARTAAPGGQAVFPHTLTNTGNGTDDFPLALANLVGDDFDLAGLAIYADANGDGVPDNFTPLATTGPLAAGAAFRFVVAGNVPGTQTRGQIARARVTATSTFDGTQTAFNTDVATVTGNAVVSVTKAISQSSGASPSGPYTYTLSYANTGNSTATSVRLTDLIPAGMTYVGGSGRWSVTGAAVLTDLGTADAQGVAPNTIVYDFGGTTGNTVTAVIAQVVPGATGTLTFDVTVDAGLPPGTIDNAATYAYNDGAGNVGPFTTNNAPFTVNQASSLTFTGQTVASAFQGATVAFSNTLANTGNGTDVFNITVGGSTFPAGTTFALFQSDGVTPLTDTNGDALPDPGPLAAGASTTIVLRASLPPGAGAGGPYGVGKTATSVSSPLVSAVANDVLTAIVASSVDVTNDAPFPAAGGGPGPEAAPVRTLAVNAGATATFVLYVNNRVGQADNYDLAASTDPTFGSITLPAGWTVGFRDGASAAITNTGNVPPGGAVLVYADVTVPAGYAAGPVSLYFRARSPVTGAQDRKHDAASVNVARSLTVVPNNSAQVAPGGAAVYTHLIANNGNVVEGDGAGSNVTLANSNTQVGWSSALYHDTNNSGVLDAGDLAISDLGSLGGIAPGTTVRVFVNVFAPAGAALGSVNVTTLAATTTNVGYASPAPPVATADDNTTVINGQLQLVKQQALDTTCDGIADGAYTVANLTTGAIPGACLRYEITVTNVGTATANNVVVSDATPPNTSYSAAVPATTSIGGIATPANGAAGAVTATVGSLGPGQSAVVVFGIRIDP
ncbi:MAG: beta strand repeat-containing protein [Candidatus Eiseniibacteriota bacterium]